MESIDRRRTFMRLPDRERDAALWNMLMDEISERVKLIPRIIAIEDDIKYIKGELEGIAHRRSDTLELNTEQKIQAELQKQNAGWLWYRDKILPGTLMAIQTGIILAVLYLAFGGKIP
jgi:hypothetical protein